MTLPAIAPYPLPGADELPHNRVRWSPDADRAVLLVHDMQHYFLDAFPQDTEPLTGLLAHTGELALRCRQRGVPVLYSAQPGGQTPAQRGLQQDFWGPGLPDDAHAAAVAAPVAPEPGETVLTKWKYSAFVHTELAEHMRALGRDQLVIAGVYAHIGVLMTACDAWMRDIKVFVAADAVADFSRTDHDTALRWAAGRCAFVTTTGNLLKEL